MGCGNSTVTETACASREEGFDEKTLRIFGDIKSSLGIDFVPNMYRKLAANPEYLESVWNNVHSLMGGTTRLDVRTKDIIAFTVSVMSGCEYCFGVYDAALRHHGADEETMLEIYRVIETYSGLNRLNIVMRTQADEGPWFGCGGTRE
jgi:AhpD family alkylhydroperoxidase